MVLFLGSITEYYKGLDILLESFALLEKKYPHLKLEIWGSGDLSPYSQLIASLDHIRIENRWIDDSEVSDIFRQSDICLLPYRDASQSGISGSASEAAIPIVACPAKGLLEQLEGGGVLFSSDFTPESYAAEIEKLVTNTDLYHQLSGQALLYSQQFNWESIGNQLFELSREIVAGNRRSNASD